MTTVEKKMTSPTSRASKRNEKVSVFFYEGGGRSKVLNQILHCVKFSPGVIALTGPTGSGRSLIIQSLAQSFKEEESDLCIFSEDSPVLETEEELYRALAEGFGLEQKPVEILEDLVDRVQHFIRVGLRGKRHLLIAVDDVKQHSEDVLEALLHLVGSNKGLSVLLSGETSLLDVLKQFHVQSLLIHQISLRPLLTEEASDFLRQYLTQQGVSDESALSRKKLDELMSRTGGNLSLLVREAQQLVLSLQVNSKQTRANFPILHMAALASVITITVLAFLYYPTSTKKVADDDLQKSVPATVAETTKVPSVVEEPKIEIVEATSSDINSRINMPSAPEPAAVEPETSPSVGEKLFPAKQSTEGSVKNAEEPVSSEPSVVLQQEYTPQEQELLNKPKSNVTLQVSSLTSEKMAKAFIQQCASSDAAHLYYYRRGSINKPSYVVIYGDYSNKQEAMNAQNLLSVALKKSSPWPRSLADVQRDLRQRESSK